MKDIAFILMFCGLCQMARADSIVVMNRTMRDISNMEVRFENSSGAHSIQKLAKLASRDKKEISVSFKGIPAGDGSYTLTFSYQGSPYLMRFGYGPSMSKTTVLIAKRFSVLKPGQPAPTESTADEKDLVLVTWVD